MALTPGCDVITQTQIKHNEKTTQKEAGKNCYWWKVRRKAGRHLISKQTTEGKKKGKYAKMTNKDLRISCIGGLSSGKLQNKMHNII